MDPTKTPSIQQASRQVHSYLGALRHSALGPESASPMDLCLAGFLPWRACVLNDVGRMVFSQPDDNLTCQPASPGIDSTYVLRHSSLLSHWQFHADGS